MMSSIAFIHVPIFGRIKFIQSVLECIQRWGHSHMFHLLMTLKARTERRNWT